MLTCISNQMEQNQHEGIHVNVEYIRQVHIVGRKVDVISLKVGFIHEKKFLYIAAQLISVKRAILKRKTVVESFCNVNLIVGEEFSLTCVNPDGLTLIV